MLKKIFVISTLMLVLTSCKKETSVDQQANLNTTHKISSTDLEVKNNPSTEGLKVDPVPYGGGIDDITMEPGDLGGGDPSDGPASDYYSGASNCLGGYFDVTHDGGYLTYNVNYTLDQVNGVYVTNNFTVKMPLSTPTMSYKLVSKSLTYDIPNNKAFVKIVYEVTQKITTYDPRTGKPTTTTTYNILSHNDIIDICNGLMQLG